jgi:hypothetical protein
MIDGAEKKLVEALLHVDAHGDVAPYHVHDPMTMLMRDRAVQANLVRWDDEQECYVLTSAGQQRISMRSPPTAEVLPFTKNNAARGSAPRT